MADASSVRKAYSLPKTSAGKPTIVSSAVRYSGDELNVATPNQWVPLGRTIINAAIEAADDAIDQNIFIADRPYEVVSVSESHSTIASGTFTVQVNKVANGGIGNITIGNAGSSYTIAPIVAITGGGGSGATATAVLGSVGTAGTIVSFTITNPGSGYTTVPTVTITRATGDTTGINGAGTAVLGASAALGTNVLTAVLDLNGVAANLVTAGVLATTSVPIEVNGTLTTVNRGTLLAAGDRLALHFSGTATGLTGAIINVVLKSI